MPSIRLESTLERPANFAWETHEYLKITEQGTIEFIERMKNQDWGEIRDESDLDTI